MKKTICFLLLFLLMFCIVECFGISGTYGDSINNYMFSHAIVLGEVPYLDFNMISTPLYPMFMSIGLCFWDNHLMFMLEQVLLLTVFFFILYQIYGKKCFIALLCGCLFSFFAFNATYNFAVLFCLVLLLYLEEKHSNKDYLIGIIIGLSILSKHTTGLLLLLPSVFYYWKDKKKLLKRGIGVLIPCVLFSIYLLVNGAFSSFIDLCFLGLFDFSSENGFNFSWYLVFSILLFIIQIIITYKKHKDIKNYYLLMGISLVLPIFDFPHFAIYVFCFVLQLLPFITKYEDYFGTLAFILSIVVSVFLFMVFGYLVKPVFATKIPKFQYSIMSSLDYQKVLNNYKTFDKYDNSLILSYGTMQGLVQYKISTDEPITYFDILMYGNYGYRGSYKMIDRLKKMNDIYILVDMSSYKNKSSYNQFDKTIVEYVIKNYNKVDSQKNFNIYYKN